MVVPSCSNDRNKDVAVLHWLGFSAILAFVAFFVLLIPARPTALTIIMILLGMWLILLTQSAITSLLLLMPLVGLFKWQHMPVFFVGPFLVAILWQTTLLLRKCCVHWSGATATSTVLKAFHRSMLVLSLVLILLSVALLYTGSTTWPSETSFIFAGASYFVFAYGVWFINKGTGPSSETSTSDHLAVNFKGAGSRDVISGDQSSLGFSSNDVCSDRSPVWVLPWIMLLYPISYSVLLVLFSPLSSTEVYTHFLVLFLTLGCHPFFFQRILLAPVHFHAQPDASILVETISETYVYHKAIRVFLEPAGLPPKATELCHVYCTDFRAPRVVVEIMGGTKVHMTPKYPEEFVYALTRVINWSDDGDNDGTALVEEEVVSCGIK